MSYYSSDLTNVSLCNYFVKILYKGWQIARLADVSLKKKKSIQNTVFSECNFIQVSEAKIFFLDWTNKMPLEKIQ